MWGFIVFIVADNVNDIYYKWSNYLLLLILQVARLLNQVGKQTLKCKGHCVYHLRQSTCEVSFMAQSLKLLELPWHKMIYQRRSCFAKRGWYLLLGLCWGSLLVVLDADKIITFFHFQSLGKLLISRIIISITIFRLKYQISVDSAHKGNDIHVSLNYFDG